MDIQNEEKLSRKRPRSQEITNASLQKQSNKTTLVCNDPKINLGSDRSVDYHHDKKERLAVRILGPLERRTLNTRMSVSNRDLPPPQYCVDTRSFLSSAYGTSYGKPYVQQHQQLPPNLPIENAKFVLEERPKKTKTEKTSKNEFLSGDSRMSGDQLSIRIIGPMEPFVPPEIEYSKWMDTPKHAPTSVSEVAPDFGFGYGTMGGATANFIDKKRASRKRSLSPDNIEERSMKIEKRPKKSFQEEGKKHSQGWSRKKKINTWNKENGRVFQNKKLSYRNNQWQRKRKRNDLINKPHRNEAHKFVAPKYKIRILTPMIPLERKFTVPKRRNRRTKRRSKAISPIPKTPAAPETPFNPHDPYNSSHYLMKTEVHPQQSSGSCNDDDDIFNIFGYGSMDFAPCEELYGQFMDSPLTLEDTLEDSSSCESSPITQTLTDSTFVDTFSLVDDSLINVTDDISIMTSEVSQTPSAVSVSSVTSSAVSGNTVVSNRHVVAPVDNITGNVGNLVATDSFRTSTTNKSIGTDEHSFTIDSIERNTVNVDH